MEPATESEDKAALDGSSLRKLVEEKRAEVQRMADERAEGERRALREFASELGAIGERMVARFSSLPCGGEVSRVGDCSGESEAACEWNQSPSCPKRIADHDRLLAEIRWKEQLVASDVPAALLEVALRPQPTHSTALIDSFLASDMRLQVLSGGVGVGKSVAAAYAIRRVGMGRWVSAREFSRLGNDAGEKTLPYRRTKLLVLDDLGLEHDDGKGWAIGNIQALLVERHDDGRRTVITTNLDAAAFKQRYGERVADRIRGSGRFSVVDGESMRRRS